MRKIVRERGDFFFAQGIRDVGHCRYATANPQVRLVVMQRLDEVFFALAGETRDRFRSGECITVA